MISRLGLPAKVLNNASAHHQPNAPEGEWRHDEDADFAGKRSQLTARTCVQLEVEDRPGTLVLQLCASILLWPQCPNLKNGHFLEFSFVKQPKLNKITSRL